MRTFAIMECLPGLATPAARNASAEGGPQGSVRY
jgi:hypothetical protein